MKSLAVTVAIYGALVLAGCGGDSSSPNSTAVADSSTVEAKPVSTVQGPEPKISVPGGPPPKRLVVKDLKNGSGAAAKLGDKLTAQFVAVYYVSGKKFESSWDAGQKPFSFRLNSDEVSPGWVRGIPGMKAGGRRELIVPTKLISRYGVPPGAGPEDTLVYVIDLLDVR